MLNETVSPEAMMIAVIVSAILFLLAMWGGFWFFVKFKRKDDAYRAGAQKYFKSKRDNEKPF